MDLGLLTKSADLQKDHQAEETPSARTLRAVCENPGLTSKQIGGLVGLDVAREFLPRLDHHDFIEATGLGGSYWQPTERGAEWFRRQKP